MKREQKQPQQLLLITTHAVIPSQSFLLADSHAEDADKGNKQQTRQPDSSGRVPGASNSKSVTLLGIQTPNSHSLSLLHSVCRYCRPFWPRRKPRSPSQQALLRFQTLTATLPGVQTPNRNSSSTRRLPQITSRSHRCRAIPHSEVSAWAPDSRHSPEPVGCADSSTTPFWNACRRTTDGDRHSQNLPDGPGNIPEPLGARDSLDQNQADVGRDTCCPSNSCSRVPTRALLSLH